MSPAERKGLALAIATALAVPAEGLRQWAYLDPPEILTVCRGHTGPDVVKGKKYSLKECDQYMTNDMRKAVSTVEACVPNLPVEVLAAFSDAVYNLGPKVACSTQHSTAARMLKAGDIKGACDQLPRWNRASIAGISVELPGLTKRRAMERDLCIEGLT